MPARPDRTANTDTGGRPLHRSLLRPLRRTVTAALALSLAGAVVADVGVPRRTARRPGPGTVRDVPLPFTGGTLTGLGRVTAAGATRLRSAVGLPADWRSPSVPVGAARMVGLSWRNTPDAPWTTTGGARAWLRTAGSSGWSAWSAAEPADDGPDPGSGEDHPQLVYTDGVWLAAGTRAVQVRIELPGRAAASVEQLSAHLVEPDLTPVAPDVPPRGGAGAMPMPPAIITRARWGADERLRRSPPRYASTVLAAFVHHTGQTNHYTRAESAALVRADYLYHVRSRGWNDLGYNFLIDRYGQVFEGRAGGVGRPVIGACTAGFNTYTSCVALIGTFSSARPPAVAMAALRRLLAWKLDLTHVDPAYTTVLTSAGGATTRYRRGTRVRVRTISGHRDTSYTACPGTAVYRQITRLRLAVAATGGPKIYGGGASAASIDPAEGPPVALASRFKQRMRWHVEVTGSNGRVLRRWAGIGRSARVVWNGLDAHGLAAPAGRATFTVTATVGGRAARPLTTSVTVR
jgi:hypothetical protein